MKRTTVGVLAIVVGLGVAIASNAQVKAQKADKRLTVATTEAMRLERIAPDRFDTLADNQRIVHGNMEITAGELRRQTEARAEVVLRKLGRAAEASRLWFEARRLEFANEQDGMAEAQLAAAEKALAELQNRGRTIRRTR